MSILSVKGLNVAVHGATILSDIAFEINGGERFGIMGKSGSGKSMTALSVMGLLPGGSRRTGTASMGCTDLFALSEPEMCKVRGRDIGMIFQEPMKALNPLKAIGDQVAEPLMLHDGIGRSDALSLAGTKLERVGLPPSRYPLTAYPHELSGGQRQRVCIAMAIARRPKLLIADEPTTALDVSTQSRILRLLASLTDDEGMSLMLITHDLAVIAEMTGRTAVMMEGQIVESGLTRSLFRSPSHPYAKMLLKASLHAPKRATGVDSEVFLDVRGAVKEYSRSRTRLARRADQARAVDRVSLVLHRGESLGLVGESGCGKSTLARAVLGLERLKEGSVLIDGYDTQSRNGMPRRLRRKIQAVFQDPYGSFNPRHRVERLVSEPLYLAQRRMTRQERRNVVASALTDVGMSPGDMSRYIHQFSGGQRQRIALARALVLRPEIIVLDEALSALDVPIRSRMLDLLCELKGKHGLAYLFISHDLTVVEAVTDRVLVMQDGRIVEEGLTGDVFRAPRHDCTKALLAAAPKIPSDWTD